MRLLNILKENNIIKISPEDHLSSALTKLSTSHDAAFVFDQTDKFIGVINPYYCLIKSSYPGNTKVVHCLYHPPRIYVNYPLTKVAELFNQSKIHYLPVFDQQEKFLGIISVRRVLTHIKTLPIFKIKIKEIIKFKKFPVTIYDNGSVSEALNLFKTYKFSKLIVINHEGRLKGVLSYYDLISFMVMPKNKEKRGEREGNRTHLSNQPIKYFYKTY
ncbi:MAG: CBS domain-containing protein, partial [Candidatus Roizmanbacteria bacterium]